jgi:hypothetical protein
MKMSGTACSAPPPTYRRKVLTEAQGNNSKTREKMVRLMKPNDQLQMKVSDSGV